MKVMHWNSGNAGKSAYNVAETKSVINNGEFNATVNI
jgi:hypothetical protein